jgi:hypothetical protein
MNFVPPIPASHRREERKATGAEEGGAVDMS